MDTKSTASTARKACKRKHSVSRLWPHDFPARVIVMLMGSALIETILGLAFYTHDMVECDGNPTCIQTRAKVSKQLLPRAFSSIAVPDPNNDRFLALLCVNVALMVTLPHVLILFWRKYVVSLARTTPGYEVQLRAVFEPRRLALVMVISAVLLVCGWTTLYFGNVGIPFVRRQSYLFCLYTLFSNIFWTWILFKIIRRIYPDKLARVQLPPPLPLRAFLQRINVHWTVLHVAAAPIIRALFSSDFVSDGGTDFGRDLQFAYQETSFFVWSAVFTTRMIQIGSETIFAVLMRRFRRQQRETLTQLNSSVVDLTTSETFQAEPWYLKRLRAAQRDRTTDVWFAFTVLYAYSYIFGIGFPVTSLLSILGILLEWAYQYYRVKVLKVPERAPDAKPFLARFMIFDLRMFSLYAVIVLAIVLPLRAKRYWIVIAVAALSFIISWCLSMVYTKHEAKQKAADLFEFVLVETVPRSPTVRADQEAQHDASMHKSHYAVATPSMTNTTTRDSGSDSKVPTKVNTYSQSGSSSATSNAGSSRNDGIHEDREILHGTSLESGRNASKAPPTKRRRESQSGAFSAASVPENSHHGGMYEDQKGHHDTSPTNSSSSKLTTKVDTNSQIDASSVTSNSKHLHREVLQEVQEVHTDTHMVEEPSGVASSLSTANAASYTLDAAAALQVPMKVGTYSKSNLSSASVAEW